MTSERRVVKVAVDSHVPVYPIGVVQRLTGLSARQIRYYEKEGLLSPSRTRGNRRLYSSADVQRLKQVKELLAQGLNLEGVRAYLRAQERAPMAGAAGEPPAPGAAAGVRRPADRTGPAGGAGPVERLEAVRVGELPVAPDMPRHPAIFREARGRRLSSLFPVDHQDELVRLLEDTRSQETQQAQL